MSQCWPRSSRPAIWSSASGFTAVDRISFAVPEGVIFGFLGPNGAGKTTTIKMLTTVLTPSEGAS